MPEVWTVLRAGTPVARLSAPRVRDMLWTHYQVDAIDPADTPHLTDPSWWEASPLAVVGPDGRREDRVRIRPRDGGGVNVRTSVAEGPTGRERRAAPREGLRIRLRRRLLARLLRRGPRS